MTYTWGVDIYSGSNITLDKLQKLYNAGARILVVKSSMGYGDDINVEQAVTWGKQIGFITGIYHWIDPTNTAQAQIDRFSKWIDKLNPNFGASDHEQWWGDWNKYFAYLRGEIAGSEVPKLTPSQIDSVGKSFMLGIKNKYPKFFNFLYSAQWFDNYDPLMGSTDPTIRWIDQYPGWYASGDKYSGPHNYSTWQPFYDYLNTLSTYKPLLPNGATKCTLLQFTGAAHFPGLSGAWDVNYFKGTEKEFKDMVLQGVVVPPTPSPVILNTYLTLSTMNVRSGPGVSYGIVGTLPYGKTVYSYEEVSPDGVYYWAKIDPVLSKYACIKIQSAPQYLMRKV